MTKRNKKPTAVQAEQPTVQGGVDKQLANPVSSKQEELTQQTSQAEVATLSVKQQEINNAPSERKQADNEQTQSKQTSSKRTHSEQAVKSSQNSAETATQSNVNSLSNEGENVAEKKQSAPEKKVQSEAMKVEKTESTTEQVAQKVEQKSGGKGVALLALLVALGIGGAGYYFGLQKFNATEQRLNDVQANVQQQIQQFASRVATTEGTQTAVEMPTFEAEKAQLAKLAGQYQQALEQISQLSHQQAMNEKQVSSLQAQLKQLGATPKAEPTVWLLSDADFLLTNALRKIAIDYDIDTAKSLLMEADNTLSQLDDPQIVAVRSALKADLNNLNSLNQVDQNNVMQSLATLANLVDDMPMLDNEQLAVKENGEVSDSIEDWQKNLEKSADSFLSHFIRVSDKKQVKDKAFIAPNQEVYLRENIRLRLQIAILAVPRQQNELYKQSLEAVSSWVRSYFDVQSEVVKNFLKDVDDLIEQSIYIDAPTKLQSLDLLKQKLNRQAPAIQKMELEVGKDVQQMKVETPVEAVSDVKPTAEQQPATSQPVEAQAQ